MAEAASLGDLYRAILRLLGPRGRQPAALTEDQWQAVDQIAADQRLQPHLQGRLQRGEIGLDVPDAISANWAAAYRANALEGLAQRRDLLTITGNLHGARIASVALKGAWLAWQAYPTPAERVLRDLDLLVAEADAPRSLDILLGMGLTPLEPMPDDPVAFAQAHKQFPPLLCDSGTVVELHAHAWEPPGSMEWPTPPTRDSELLARATGGEGPGLKYLRPRDMLAHLVIHAAYSHRFEVGPLLLSDIDFLLQAVQIDWPTFWRHAATGHYARGAALTLALVDHWRSPGLLMRSDCPIALPDETIANASALLLQSPATRRDTRSFAALHEARESGGLARAAALGFARIGKTIGNPAHLAKRLAETASSIRSSDTQAHARSSASIGQWLEGAD